MKIDKIKVRPKKDLAVAPCAAEFAAMLACWASSNDLSNTGTCADRGRALQDCLRTKGKGKAPHRSTINYHLARFSKRM